MPGHCKDERIISRDDIKSISLSVLSMLGDPELVMYFMRFYIPMVRNSMTEVSRDFHLSLRIKPSDRWSRLHSLCESKAFSKISSFASVPITCPLPIGGALWRTHKTLSHSIRFMRGSFIRKEVVQANGVLADETSIRDKVSVINMINLPLQNVPWSYREIVEAETDYVVAVSHEDDDEDEDETPYDLLPHVCILASGGYDIIN